MAGFDLGPLKASLSSTYSMTWTNTTTYGTTNESKQVASLVIGGASTSWTGGTLIDVYYDKIYGTFLFTFDPDSVQNVSESTALQRTNAASVQGTVTVADKPAPHEEVLLTVGGRKFLTFTNLKGIYKFYNKPRGAATITIRGLSEPISIGATTVVHNRRL